MSQLNLSTNGADGRNTKKNNNRREATGFDKEHALSPLQQVIYMNIFTERVCFHSYLFISWVFPNVYVQTTSSEWL